MSYTRSLVTTLAAGALALSSSSALADDGSNTDSRPESLLLASNSDATRVAVNTPNSNLPPPVSDDDPQPPVAQPAPPPGGIVEQAGVGGIVGYGRAGVLELGGSAGLTAASDFTAANMSPSIGWFFTDNVQLSGILGVSHISTGQSDATMVSMLVEPSYHVPFNRELFGFLGMGMGGAHVDDSGIGFALAPRLGANIMVGRSGVLTPSLSYQYTTHDTVDMAGGEALAVVSTALSANVGYTVMW